MVIPGASPRISSPEREISPQTPIRIMKMNRPSLGAGLCQSSFSGFLQKAKHRFRQGFTLVEVTLAIGVVSFAMIAMLGLLPVGLTTFQEASTLSVRSQIAQALASEVGRTDYANVIGKMNGKE